MTLHPFLLQSPTLCPCCGSRGLMAQPIPLSALCHLQAPGSPHHSWSHWLQLSVSLEYSCPDSLPSGCSGGSYGCCPGPGSPCHSLLQANVEHMTEKMKTEIQRGLVLR